MFECAVLEDKHAFTDADSLLDESTSIVCIAVNLGHDFVLNRFSCSFDHAEVLIRSECINSHSPTLTSARADHVLSFVRSAFALALYEIV